jgi:hypothetical protein
MPATTATPDAPETEAPQAATDTSPAAPAEPTIKELTAQLAKVAAFAGAIKDTETIVRTNLTRRMLEMHDELGTKSLEVRDADGEVVVTFVVVQPTANDEIKVSDEEALLDYVLDNFPGEVETITRVRDSFKKVLLGRVEVSDGVAYDTTGEAVPGLTHVHTPAAAPTSITTKWKPGSGKQKALAMALADGGISPLELDA